MTNLLPAALSLRSAWTGERDWPRDSAAASGNSIPVGDIRKLSWVRVGWSAHGCCGENRDGWYTVYRVLYLTFYTVTEDAILGSVADDLIFGWGKGKNRKKVYDDGGASNKL